jgi:hypothetical protein
MITFKQFINEAKISANKALELFVFGGCLSFAVALQKKIGGEIFVISHEGKKLHAFIRTPNGDFDVKGKRGTFSMTRDFSSYYHGWEVEGPLEPSQIPFKNTPKLVEKAEQYINDNPQLFKDK